MHKHKRIRVVDRRKHMNKIYTYYTQILIKHVAYIDEPAVITLTETHIYTLQCCSIS